MIMVPYHSTMVRISLELNYILVKLWFSLSDDGNPQACGPYNMKEANKLIEEFMLLANMSVAKKIVVNFPEVALLRQHSPPKEKTILEFIQQANALGFSQFNEEELDAGQLEIAFKQIECPVKKMVLELLCVRPMMRATYVF
jgi:exoribonuclease R